jgi:hypothetical protein
MDETIFEILVEVGVKVVVPIVVIGVDDNSADELSVELTTLFNIVVSALVTNSDAVVPLEVAVDVSSIIVLNVCVLVELETSFITEID